MKRALPVVLVLSCLVLVGSLPRSQAQEKVSTSLAATLHAPAGSVPVAASPTTVVLGSPTTPAAYVYERNLGGANHWGQSRILAPSNPDDQDFGYSVAISGNTIAVGVDDGGQIGEGAVYIFDRNRAGTWSRTKRIPAPYVTLLGGFGYSVALSGDTLVVGTATLDTAYMLSRNKGGKNNWGVVKKLTGPSNSFFGTAVSVSGDLAVIGTDAEVAYLFNRNQGGTNAWGLVKTFRSPVFDEGGFGSTVAVSGTTIVIGSPTAGAYAPGEGIAFVYGRNQGGPAAWGLVAQLISPDGDTGRHFGTSVAISGDVIVAGSPPDFGNGSACLFSRSQGGPNLWGAVALWQSTTATTFGSSAAISGDTAAVGQSGGAFIFRINP